MYDTVIIGAGMSGLAAGIRLAYFDQKVCILERHTTIGGLNSFYRLRGRNYDVGLHAVTNFTPKGAKKGPLARLLRQLRFSWEDFSLSPQTQSVVAFPQVQLRFNNDFAYFQSEVERAFPKQKDRFQRFVEQLTDYDDLNESNTPLSARSVLNEAFSDPLLVEMLFCPLMYYGSAREEDMDWGQFCIMFRSIFCEGFARPFNGVRTILKLLTRKFKELGGELKLRAGVSKIVSREGEASHVVLDDGTELAAKRILSSAGYPETLKLCGGEPGAAAPPAPGRLSFVESIAVLDQLPKDLGHRDTIVFFNDSNEFHYRRSKDLVDVRSGVICSPNNFAYDGGKELPEGIVRLTCIANYDRWAALTPEQYALEKLRWYDRMSAAAVRFIPEFRHRVVDTDVFTPTTVRRFTGHEQGAIYGAPDKRFLGTTHLKNLFICGTDQGFMGIVGTIISGISMANMHCLK